MGDSMGILLFVFGVLLGIVIGALIVAKLQVECDKKAAYDGVIKLVGSIYKLDKIEL